MPRRRKAERPSHAQLRADLSELSWVAVGAKYGVSDNAVRKWIRSYEAAAGRADSGAGETVALADGTTTRQVRCFDV